MLSYTTTPTCIETWSDTSGQRHEVLNVRRVEMFKQSAEAQINSLTIAMQTLENHANWIEPRLQEFIKFNQWMEKAHPDIINAYKASTAVADKLDKANEKVEMIYPQTRGAA